VGGVGLCSCGRDSTSRAGSVSQSSRDSVANTLFGWFGERSSAEMWRIDSTLRANGTRIEVLLSPMERALWLDSIAAYSSSPPAERLYLPLDARPWIPACVWLRPQLHHGPGDGGFRAFGSAADTLVLRCRGDRISGGRGQSGEHWRQVHDPTCDSVEEWQVSAEGKVIAVKVTCGRQDTHGHRGYGDGHFGKPHEHDLVREARTVSVRQRAIARRLARARGGLVLAAEK